MLKVFAVKIAEPIPKVQFDYLMQFVQPQKAVKIKKQRIKQNADNMLIGEVLVRIAIKRTFGIAIKKQAFLNGEYGKPYIARFSGVHFNISHSGQYVVCAVCDRAVGIDIQCIEKYNALIAQRICSEKELEEITESTDKAAKLCELWTQKEAYLKMTGCGIAYLNLKEVNVENAIAIQRENYFISVCV